MSNEKKNEETEVVKEEARQLSEEEIAQVTGGATGGVKPFMGDRVFGFIDSEQVRITTNYPISGDDE